MILARPYKLHVPEHEGAAMPLVIALHGYGANGERQDRYWGLSALTAKGVMVATPDGLLDNRQIPYWDATDACCNFDRKRGLDDVGYVMAIVDDVAKKHALDPKRVFMVGHSNGGFLAHRIACEKASRVAAIVSVAAGTWSDASKCTPDAPVAVLEIHGTADEIIKPEGGYVFDRQFMAPYPPVAKTMASWRKLEGCSGELEKSGDPFDLDERVPGAETTALRYAGCRAGGAVELWSMKGSLHSPMLAKPAFADAVYAWLMAHPKP